LEAALDYLRLNYPGALRAGAGERLMTRRKRALLARLAATKPNSREIPKREKAPLPPDRGHPPSWVGAFVGTDRRSDGYLGLALRPALHGLLDPPGGAPIDGELELMSAAARYSPAARRVRLESLTVFRASAFPTAATLDVPLAFRFDAGGSRVDLEQCLECLTFGTEMALGLSSAMFTRASAIYVLATAFGGFPVGRSADRVAVAVGSTGGIRLFLSLTTSAAFEVRYRHWLLAAEGGRAEVSGAVRQVFGRLGGELRFTSDRVGVELQAGALWYF
jgi:hypothetical protein